MNDVNYAWAISAIDRDDLIAFEKWLSRYQRTINDKILYIWGAGIRGTEFGVFLRRNGISEFLFVDNHAEKWGGHIDGNRIVSPDIALKDVRNKNAIILVSIENDSEIISQLMNEGLEQNKDFYTAPNREYENYVHEYTRSDEAHFVIMGDCLFSSISLADSNTSNLAEMVRDELGISSCKVLYMHGMGIRSYYNLFRMYCVNYGVPKSIEIMVNFETLTGRQHLLPRSQHSQLFHMIDEAIVNKDDEWKEYLNVVDERSNNLGIEMSHNSSNLTPEQERDLKNRNYLRFNYMYKLDTETEGLQYLRKLVEYANDKNVQVIPYIPPVNYELGKKYFGDTFEDAYNSNLEKVVDCMREMNLQLEDYSHIFTSDYFCEPDTTDESVNEKGREVLKKRLIKRLKNE